MTYTPTYEEAFGPVERRLRRVQRRASWARKTALGRRRDILIEMSWRLGDEVMALPIYAALHTAYPDARIAVLCNYPDLLDGNPHVHAVNVCDFNPDRYILLRSAERDVYRLDHYAACAELPTPQTRPTLHFEDWNCPWDDDLPRNEPLVAVSSGASWDTKRWPVNRWRLLCASLEIGGCSIVELGLSADGCIGEGISLVDKTSVREAACVLRRAQLFIGSDSGLMHLALAVGTPVLALFGPTDPSILVRNDANLHVITNARDCEGCWNGVQTMRQPGLCPLDIQDCMGPIETKAVIARARALLGIDA